MFDIYDTTKHILSYLHNGDRLHFITCSITLYNLYKQELDPSNEYNNSFYYAVKENNVDLISKFLQDTRVDKGCCSYALLVAIKYRNIPIIRLLVKDGRANPDEYNNCIIREAATYGDEELVELLLKDPRVDPSALDNNAIRNASERLHYKVVAALLKDPRVDPTACGNKCIKTLYKLIWTISPCDRDRLINTFKILLKCSRVRDGISPGMYEDILRFCS